MNKKTKTVLIFTLLKLLEIASVYIKFVQIPYVFAPAIGIGYNPEAHIMLRWLSGFGAICSTIGVGFVMFLIGAMCYCGGAVIWDEYIKKWIEYNWKMARKIADKGGEKVNKK